MTHIQCHGMPLPPLAPLQGTGRASTDRPSCSRPWPFPRSRRGRLFDLNAGYLQQTRLSSYSNTSRAEVVLEDSAPAVAVAAEVAAGAPRRASRGATGAYRPAKC